MSDFDPDAFIAQAEQSPAMDAGINPEGFDPDAFIETAQQEKYGTPGQQVIAGLEGVAKGFAGPLATGAERLLGVDPEDVRGRAEANPWTHGIGEAAGFGAGMLTGTGEAALLSKVGEGAVALSGLAKAGEAASIGAKIGSEAVRQAAEMAVFQGGDEVSKMILKDPDQSAQTAIASVGLASALGGLTGGAFGAVNPLWKATVGPALDDVLSPLKRRLEGGSGLLPKEGVESATKGLGIQLEPLEQAMVSDKSHMLATALERDNPKAIEAIEGLKNKVSNSVAESAGVKAEDILNYDKADSGHLKRDIFEKEFREKLAPIEEALNKQAAEDAHIAIPDEVRLNQFGKLIEEGQRKFTPTSEYAKLYETYGQQLLDHDTVGGVVKLESEIGNKIRGLNRTGGDYNTIQALKDIKNELRSFRENHITNNIIEMAGQEGKGIAAEKIAQDLANRKAYGQAARVIDEAQDHFGLGSFEGKESLARRIGNLTGEEADKKLSFKGNRDAIAFLQEHFPETFQAVRQAEAREFLKPSMQAGAKKGTAIDINKLSDAIAKAKAGQSTYLQSILPEETINRVSHAQKLLNALPETRSSKTAKWTEKLFAHVPASVLASVQLAAGHNPLSGVVIGELASKLQKEAPDAVKLAYLQWLGSEKPINSAAFKSMVDFIDAARKGESTLTNATKAIFKGSGMVIGSSLIPSSADRTKLDKMVTEFEKDPTALQNALTSSETGHYMPNHQMAQAKASTQALQYLQQLKPKPHVVGPFDKEEPPTPAEKARYDRALNIATEPAIVFQHIKDGTIVPSDIQDLKAMYPDWYKASCNKLMNEIATVKDKGITVPYKTRIGLSLYMGSPLDASMQPTSIQAAQPQPQPIQPMQGGAQGKTRKGTSTLGKSNASHMTGAQRAEQDRMGR